MDDGENFWFGFGIGFVLCLCSLTPILYYKGVRDTMEEAYYLNLAKECLGKEGYYFTCEDK